jgi:hypothetical protein
MPTGVSSSRPSAASGTPASSKCKLRPRCCPSPRAPWAICASFSVAPRLYRRPAHSGIAWSRCAWDSPLPAALARPDSLPPRADIFSVSLLIIGFSNLILGMLYGSEIRSWRGQVDSGGGEDGESKKDKVKNAFEVGCTPYLELVGLPRSHTTGSRRSAGDDDGLCRTRPLLRCDHRSPHSRMSLWSAQECERPSRRASSSSSRPHRARATSFARSIGQPRRALGRPAPTVPICSRELPCPLHASPSEGAPSLSILIGNSNCTPCKEWSDNFDGTATRALSAHCAGQRGGQRFPWARH